MDSHVTDSDTPDLRLGNTGQEAFAGREGVFRDLKVAGSDINCHNPPQVASFNLRPHLPLVDFHAELGMFFFAVMRLTNGHGISLPYDAVNHR